MPEMSRRDLVRGGAATAVTASLLPGGLAAAAPGAKPIDPLDLVDPDLKPFLLKALAPKPNAPPLPPRPDRYRPKTPPAPFLSEPPVVERMIPGSTGQPSVRVFLIGRLDPSRRRAAILHMHGGGFVSGRVADVVPYLQAIAIRHDCLVVSVDYRVAPETRLAGSLEDNYAALRWLSDESATLGVDRSRIAVAGESAGGGHAAMLAIAARDRGGPAIRAQVLVYPMLDDRTGSTRPVPPFIGTYVWQPEDNRYGWTSLLGVPAGSSAAPSSIVPGRVADLSGLPPSFIAVGSIDLFVDEDVEYARRLAMVGVPTDLHVYAGAYHGFDLLVPPAACARNFEDARDNAYRRAFA